MSIDFKLLDVLSFEKLISPVFITVLYWCGLAGIVFGLIAGLVSIGITSIFIAVFVALFWRIWMEMLIVAFGIHDRLGDIRDQSAATIQTVASTAPQASVTTGNFCGECGASNGAEALFCNACGSRFDTETKP